MTVITHRDPDWDESKVKRSDDGRFATQAGTKQGLFDIFKRKPKKPDIRSGSPSMKKKLPTNKAVVDKIVNRFKRKTISNTPSKMLEQGKNKVQDLLKNIKDVQVRQLR